LLSLPISPPKNWRHVWQSRDYSGGLALKFYASVRIDVRKIANIKLLPEILSVPSTEPVSSKQSCPPFKEAEFDIMNTEGISVYGSLVDMAVQ
jgi:recombination protein RecA